MKMPQPKTKDTHTVQDTKGMGEFRYASLNWTAKKLESLRRIHTECICWLLYCSQAPNGDFDNLYLDMNGRSAMASSIVPCKDNAFTQDHPSTLQSERPTSIDSIDMAQESFTRAAIQKMVPRQWTRNTCILTTASQLVSR